MKKTTPETSTPECPFLTAYGPHRKVQLHFPAGEGRTKQEFKSESDINVIMKRYEKTGVLEYVQKREAQYLDVTGLEYQRSMEIVANARSAFEDLPASLRERFGNDPAQLLTFIHDDENYEEAKELGLLDDNAVRIRADAAAETRSSEQPVRALSSGPAARAGEAQRPEAADAPLPPAPARAGPASKP